MRLTKEEKLVEQVAVLLSQAPINELEPDRTYEIIANQAMDMAYRAYRGWWDYPGKPHFEERLHRLRRLLHPRLRFKK